MGFSETPPKFWPTKAGPGHISRGTCSAFAVRQVPSHTLLVEENVRFRMVSSTAFKSSERVSYSRSRGPGTLARRHLSGDTRTRSTPSNRGPRRNRRHALVEESELVLVILGASLFDAHSTGYSTPKSVLPSPSSRSLFSPSSSLPPLLWIGASGPEKFPLSDPAFL